MSSSLHCHYNLGIMMGNYIIMWYYRAYSFWDCFSEIQVKKPQNNKNPALMRVLPCPPLPPIFGVTFYLQLKTRSNATNRRAMKKQAAYGILSFPQFLHFQVNFFLLLLSLSLGFFSMILYFSLLDPNSLLSTLKGMLLSIFLGLSNPILSPSSHFSAYRCHLDILLILHGQFISGVLFISCGEKTQNNIFAVYFSTS